MSQVLVDREVLEQVIAHMRHQSTCGVVLAGSDCGSYHAPYCERDRLIRTLQEAPAIDTPDQEDFLAAAVLEAKYQRTRWDDNDERKTDSDWFWLVGYLVGKAMHDVRGKRVHHLTAAAAALANWHASALARGETMPTTRGDLADHTGRV